MASTTAINLIKNPDFLQGGASWTWFPVGSYSVATDGATTHLYCFGDSCDWVAQDLSSLGLTTGSTYSATYSAYCRSQQGTDANPCYTVLRLAGQTYNDTLPYLTADPPNSAGWPNITHTFTYGGTGAMFNLSGVVVGDQAMWYLSHAALYLVHSALDSTSVSGSSSASSQTKTTATATSTTGAAQNGNHAQHGSTNMVPIAVGASLGCVVIILALALFFVARRRRGRDGASTMGYNEKARNWMRGPPSPPSSSHSPETGGWVPVNPTPAPTTQHSSPPPPSLGSFGSPSAAASLGSHEPSSSSALHLHSASPPPLDNQRPDVYSPFRQLGTETPPPWIPTSSGGRAVVRDVPDTYTPFPGQTGRSSGSRY